MKNFAMTCAGVFLLLFAGGFQARAGRIGDCWTDYDGTNHCGDSGSSYDWNFDSGNDSGSYSYPPTPTVDPRIQQARSFNDQGIAAFNRRKTDPTALNEAEKFFRKALEYEDHPVYHKSLAETLNSKGVRAYAEGNFAAAISFYEAALAEYPEDNDRKRQIETFLDQARRDLEYEQERRRKEEQARADMARAKQKIGALLDDFAASAGAGGARFDGDGTNAPGAGGLGFGTATARTASTPPALGGLAFGSSGAAHWNASVVDLRDIPEDRQVLDPTKLRAAPTPSPTPQETVVLPTDDDLKLLFDDSFNRRPADEGSVEDILAAWAADPARPEITGETSPGLKQFPPAEVARAFARGHGDYGKVDAMLYALHYANVISDTYGGMSAADKWNASLGFLETLAPERPAARAALDELTEIRLKSGE